MDQRRAPELNPLLGLASPKKVLMQLHFFQWHLVILLHFASALCQLGRHHADTQTIQYDSASVAQEGLGKTHLPVPFWTVVWQEVYMPKLKKKMCVFLCNVYICTAEVSMEYELQIPSFPSLPLQTLFLLLFLLYFFWFSSMSFLTS